VAFLKNPDWTRDEIIVVAAAVAKQGWKQLDKGSAESIRISELLQTFWSGSNLELSDTFRNPQGVALKSANIMSCHPAYVGAPTHSAKLDQAVVDDFVDDEALMLNVAQQIVQLMKGGASPAYPETPEYHGREGGLLAVAHLRRERDHGVREAKLKWAIKNDVRLECEVCGLFMEDLYGSRGKDYVEVHHLTPLHVSGETTTKPSDLAILCANCHRMVHRAPWTTPEELRKSLTAQLELKDHPLD
jgi:5-methylcytosine-specific restriction protein A